MRRIGPEFHNLLIWHKHPELTSDVIPMFYGRAKPNPAQVGKVYVAANDLDLNEHHICLGKYIDAWSKFELQLRHQVQFFLAPNENEAKIVAYQQSGRPLIQLLVSLSEGYLSQIKHKSYVKLTERLSRANTTRNYLVHGYWLLRIIVSVKENTPIVEQKVIREYPPPRKSEQEQLKIIGSKINQKYNWKLEDISQETDRLAGLSEEFRLFQADNFPRIEKP